MPIGFDGPIPGENFTSDTKNYPWHRPPEITELDDIVEYAAQKLMSEEGSVGLLTMMEMGVDVATLTDMFITSCIGAGKWTVDMGILAAGPISHIMCLMAKGYGIEYDLGLDSKMKGTSKHFFKAFKTPKKIDKDKAKAAVDSVDMTQVDTSGGGFMGMSEETKTEGEY